LVPKLFVGRVSAVTLAEAANVLVRRGLSAAEAIAALNPLCQNVIPFTRAHAHMVPALREKARTANLSLGDLACLAVGAVEGLSVLTNDRLWHEYDFGVKLESGRPAKKPA
jgi:ribonuclease VapC